MFGNPLRKRQTIGLIIGTLLGVLFYVLLTLESNEKYLSIGPMNLGHEEFSCITCHADANGNLWQQIQSNSHYVLGIEDRAFDFGSVDVDTKKCLDCHERDNDRHPTHRFNEPKYKDVLREINTTNCNTCHSEHHGKRVTLNKANYCINCHADLIVKNDPLDFSHENLIEHKQWGTCIQCHDFHGNHEYKTSIKMEDTIPQKKIMEYFNGGKDPYSDVKKYIALLEEELINKNK